ncbi:MAG: chromate transporter [Oscillospiraceae bacterium]|nr:chromate transporter [Oscillospiraceae bacterium]
MEKNKTGKTRLLWQLFLSCFYISAFTFGGGFVIITFMKRKFVDEKGWINEQEMLDLTALAQSAPGAIAVNAAVLVGWRIGGFLGMLTAVVGTILPPLLIISVVSLFYAAFAANRYVALVLDGMQAGVAAVILDVVCNLGKNVVKSRSVVKIGLMAAAFTATFFLKINVIYIILAAAAVGIVTETLRHKKEAKV